VEQTFRLFIILATVISRRKNQWYIVSQLLLEQTTWQAWSLLFLPMKLSVLLKIIFFISLKTTRITSKIQISEIFRSRWSCDIQFHNKICCSYMYQHRFFYDKLRPQILLVGTTANAALRLEINYQILLHVFREEKYCNPMVTEGESKSNLSCFNYYGCLHYFP